MWETNTKLMIDQTAPIPVHITNVDTGEVVVKKMLISKFVERYSAIAEQYMKMGKYAVIGEFYDDLIWTFRVGTAATDGIRIYFNPIFVYELVETCGPLADAKQEDLKKKGVNVKDPRSGFDMTFEVAKGFIFVIIHECYHQLYRHIEQSKRKKETRNATPAIHRLANISMDDEINRDIEEQFPEFDGITKLIEGCIEKEEYPHEIWMDIFDDKMQKGVLVPKGPTIPPPQQPQPPGGSGQQPDQPEQEIEAPQDYVDGWKQAIDDFKAGKLDPKKFKPLPVDPNKFGHPQMSGNGMMFARVDEAATVPSFNQDEYNQGYNDCVQKILNNMMNLSGGGQQPQGGLKVKNLPEPPSFGGGGQGQGDSQKQQQNQQQQQQGGGSGGQSGQQQQNQQAGKGSGGGSSSDRQNQKNNSQQGGGGGAANSSQEIDKMSGQQAANSAQQSANNAQQSADAAQQAANQAQQKANQSGSASDQKAADAAQSAANQAQKAADAAQLAANEAKSAANSGNDQEARDKAKEAANAADAAQQGQQSAEQKAGTGGQNGQQDIDNMSGLEAANAAQQSANQAQQSANQAQSAANQAQQKASQSGDAADQAAADAAQQAANAAQNAADAAKQAANEAQNAAKNGNDDQARNKAKEAQNAAQQAQQMAGQARQSAGQGQGQMIPPSPKPMTKGSQEMDSTQNGSKANNVGQEGDQVWKVSVGKKWGQDDLISKEEGMKISEEEGNPYTSEEYNQTPEEHARQVIEHHDQEIRNIGKGTNASMDRKMDKINEILAPPVINWKTLLYKLFKNAGVKQEEDLKMKKSRFGGGFARADRFEKITPKKREELSKNSADIFYLIDSSGSISKRDLYRAFSEIIALETRDEMNIRKSALTYFACDFDENRIRVWFRDDTKKKKMELVQYEDGKDVGGGTEIAKSVVHVTKLAKKFYSRANPRTLIIVFTDGEDYEWEPIKNLPEDIKKRTVFVILNKQDRFESIVKNILACGILEKYVVCVDTVSDLHN